MGLPHSRRYEKCDKYFQLMSFSSTVLQVAERWGQTHIFTWSNTEVPKCFHAKAPKYYQLTAGAALLQDVYWQYYEGCKQNKQKKNKTAFSSEYIIWIYYLLL